MQRCASGVRVLKGSGDSEVRQSLFLSVDIPLGQLVQIRIFQRTCGGQFGHNCAIFDSLDRQRRAGNSEKDLLLGLKRLKTSLLAPISTAKIYVSELTVHHPPTTSYSKSNQPLCVMVIPGGSRDGGCDFSSG